MRGGIPAVAILLSIGMAYILDNNGNDMLGKYIFVDKNVFLVAILFSFILFFALRKVSYIQWEIVRKCIEVLDLVVCVWIGFKPNVLKDTYNYNAYWLNVVQIYNHVPFSVVNMSFYGHYSLLMLPYFKIFGLNAISVALLQAIENAVICIAMTYCIRKITRNELLRICGTIGIMYYTGVSAMLYPQGFPHRLVPITVMLALGCKAVYSANKKLWWTIGYVASLLFIIWSTEIGVVVLAAWSILVFMYSYSSERNWKEKTGSCIIAIILMPVIFVCAWKSVSLINKLYLGGKEIPLEEFMFPLQNEDFTGVLAYSVDFKFLIWIIVVVLFLVSFFWGIKDLVLRQGEKEVIFLTFASGMGLMNLVYFFNRAAWGNLRLATWYPSILIILFLMKRMDFSCDNRCVKNFLKEGGFMGGVSLFILMAVIFTVNFPDTYNDMMKYQDITGMNKFFEELDEKIPFSVKGMDYETAFYLMESEKVNDGFYENVVNYSGLSMKETREKLLKAESSFMVDSRGYVTDYLFYWGMISEEELNQLYDEYVSFEHDGGEFVIFRPKKQRE